MRPSSVPSPGTTSGPSSNHLLSALVPAVPDFPSDLTWRICGVGRCTRLNGAYAKPSGPLGPLGPKIVQGTGIGGRS